MRGPGRTPVVSFPKWTLPFVLAGLLLQAVYKKVQAWRTTS